MGNKIWCLKPAQILVLAEIKKYCTVDVQEQEDVIYNDTVCYAFMNDNKDNSYQLLLLLITLLLLFF